VGLSGVLTTATVPRGYQILLWKNFRAGINV